MKTWNLQEFAKTARQAVAEGCVLVKNDRQALPLQEGESIAVFGRSQMNYFKSGTGSGGLVNTDYVIGIYEALESSGLYTINQPLHQTYEAWVGEHPFDTGHGWATEPWYQEEMPLTEEVVREAAEISHTAIILLGRTAGEDKDNQNEPGSFLLTPEEHRMLSLVTAAFDKTVVILNVGNIIDMTWVETYDPAAVLYAWQGGQEGGNGVLDVVSGRVNPSGHLADTIARSIEDYPSTRNFGSPTENIQQEDIYVGYRYFETFAPEKVLYPFGFGLSYTTFGLSIADFSRTQESVEIAITVKNTGKVPGQDVVQIYAEAPQEALGKARKVLVDFAKTRELWSGEAETLYFHIPDRTYASYDDSGVTGHKSAYVLEAGEYRFHVGENVRDTELAGSYTEPVTRVVQQLTEAMAPVKAFERLKPEEVKSEAAEEHSRPTYAEADESVPLQTVTPAVKREQNLPSCLPYTGDQGYVLADVDAGTISMETFLAQLSDEDLITMMRGEGMNSPKVTPGIAGAFGGVTDSLRHFGIPIGGCSDGPSGIRMDCGTHAFAMPNGAAIACSFNEELITDLFEWEALDLRRNRIDALLGPGMNIHRSPLNGRNFEYFSEDPLLTGRMAAAELRGLHAYDVTGVIKHFAGNTQETKRHYVNAVVSERAFREIYLKGFEIAVRQGKARAVMSTYGPVNGLWTSSNYDLLTQILRQEWGFTGIVMTDWWAQGNDYAGAKGSYQNVSSQVRAQNDLNMVNTSSSENSNHDDLSEALQEGRLTRRELVRSAANILRFLLETPAYQHDQGRFSDVDAMLGVYTVTNENNIEQLSATEDQIRAAAAAQNGEL